MVAVADNNVIGKDGALPWRLPDDMKHVRAVTIGKPLIMGRRTYESIGRPLPQRTNIVLTRDPDFHADGVRVAHTKDEALTIAGDVPEVIVFGGEQVFELFEPEVDRIYMTSVHAAVEGDTHFRLPGNWRIVEREDHLADDRHAYPFTMWTLERIRT